jgi:hypothetical protein
VIGHEGAGKVGDAGNDDAGDVVVWFEAGDAPEAEAGAVVVRVVEDSLLEWRKDAWPVKPPGRPVMPVS